VSVDLGFALDPASLALLVTGFITTGSLVGLFGLVLRLFVKSAGG
jgi:hypothetical protein